MLGYASYLFKKWTLGAKIAGSTSSCLGTSPLVSLGVHSPFPLWLRPEERASAAQPFTAPQGRESYCGGTDLPASPWDTVNPTGGGLDLNCFFSAKITPFWRLLCPSAEVWAAAVILQWMRAFLLSHILLFPVCGVLAYHCVGDYPCKKARAWKTSHFQHLWTRFFRKCFSLYT